MIWLKATKVERKAHYFQDIHTKSKYFKDFAFPGTLLHHDLAITELSYVKYI